MNKLIYQFTIPKWYIVVGDYYCTTLLLFCFIIITRYLFCNNGFSPDMKIMYLQFLLCSTNK